MSSSANNSERAIEKLPAPMANPAVKLSPTTEYQRLEA
jgi:hypothetical protein